MFFCIRHSLLLLSTFAGLGACSSSATDVAQRDPRTWQLQELQPDTPDDVVVARVNERPIFASCVSTQSQAHQIEKKQALQECIDFELLAQAADDAGTLHHPEVQAAGKRELVRSFVRARYEIRSPADLPESLVKQLWDQSNVPRYNHPELRNIVFCRIAITKGQGPESDEYKAAEKFLNQTYEKLRHRNDLEKNDLFAPCYEQYEAAGVHKMELLTFRLTPKRGFQAAFRATVFDGPETAGMVLPPLYTQFGWDLMLLTEVKPAKETSMAQVDGELRKALFEVPVFEPKRDAIFQTWYAPFAKARHIEVHAESLPQSAPIATAPTAPSPAGSMRP